MDQQPSYTIKEFCARWRISRSTYYEMRNLGRGPREMHVMSKVYITPQAESEWQRLCEKPADGEKVERLRQRGRKGGQLSQRSPKRAAKKVA
jgi:hypothetical protein